MYTISYPSGTIRLNGEIIEQDDSKPAYQAYALWLSQENGPEVLQDPPPKRVIEVSSWQIRAALSATGLRSAVETAVQNSTNQSLKDGWEYSTSFSSDHPLTLGLGAELDQDETAMYNLFLLAESLSL